MKVVHSSITSWNVWKVGEADLRRGQLPAFEGFLEVVQRARDLVREVFALFTLNYMLVVCKREFAAPADALPQKHRRDMFGSSGASHNCFDGDVPGLDNLLINAQRPRKQNVCVRLLLCHIQKCSLNPCART